MTNHGRSEPMEITPRSATFVRRAFGLVWPSLVLFAGLLVCSWPSVIWEDPHGGTEGSLLHLRLCELIFLATAIVAVLGSARLRSMAGSFLIVSFAMLFLFQFADSRSPGYYPSSSLIDMLLPALAQQLRSGFDSFAYGLWGVLPSAERSDLDYNYLGLRVIASWWLGASAAAAQDLFGARETATPGAADPRTRKGRWSVSLKEFLLLVTLAGWTIGVLQMPLWRQRYMAVSMLVLGVLVAAFASLMTRPTAREAGRAWLLVAGVYLGFLMLVRGDGPQFYQYLDGAASTALMEVATVPLVDEESSWDWWKEYEGDEVEALWRPQVKGYVITWASLFCCWLATSVAAIKYRRVKAREAGSRAQAAPDWGAGAARRRSAIPLIAGVLVLSGLTAATCWQTPEFAASFAMRVTEASCLSLLIVAFTAAGRLRRGALRFLAMSLALLGVEQFATFYRLENAWGDSPFLRFYAWLWNAWRGEPYPPFEHERHLLLQSLTYLHVDYLVACECVASWWLGAGAALGLDFFEQREPLVAAPSRSRSVPFWRPGRRLSLLLATSVALAAGVWLCCYPARHFAGISILEVSVLVAAVGVGIPNAARNGFWSSRSKRWFVALAVYLGLVMVASAHDRKWSYFDFGLSTSFFDLLYLHLFHGEPLAFWKIVPPADSQLVEGEAKEFATSLVALFGVWIATIAAMGWRSPNEAPESRRAAAA